MVLNRTRTLALALILSSVATAAAQRGFGAAGRGAAGSGGPRPLLFGFALECTNCQVTGRGGRGSQGGGGGGGRGIFGVWHYDEYPRIAAVTDGGAAQRAGVRVGDVLLSVDGRSLLSDEGAEYISQLRAGDAVHLTLDRNGKAVDVDLVLNSVAGRGMQALRTGAPSDVPNFVTRAEAGRVEIWSSDRVVESTDSTGARILRIGTTMIRIAGDVPPTVARGGRGRRGGVPPKH
jgi:hypothetical protein